MNPLWYPPILLYHRIHPERSSDTPTLSPESFERQMFILSRKRRPLPLSDLLLHLEKEKPLDPKGVVVTFDDGTEDTFDYACPILIRYRIPATIFLIAQNVGKPNSLNQDQIRTMATQGISFGSHTLNHAYLPSLSLTHAQVELFKSKQILGSLGLTVDTLSYPGGGFTAEVACLAKEAGYRAACTTNRGTRRFPIDRWALRRISIHEKASSSFGMWLRCSGYYGLNRRLRSPS